MKWLEGLPFVLLFGVPVLFVVAAILAVFVDGIFGTNIVEKFQEIVGVTRR